VHACYFILSTITLLRHEQIPVDVLRLLTELLAYSTQHFFAWRLPIMTLDSPCICKRRANPDHRFNIREHVKIEIMANISIGFSRSADATDMIQAAIAFYDFKLPAGFSVLVTMCSQVLGFGSLPPMAG